jgi:hypothetical protein
LLNVYWLLRWLRVIQVVRMIEIIQSCLYLIDDKLDDWRMWNEMIWNDMKWNSQWQYELRKQEDVWKNNRYSCKYNKLVNIDIDISKKM